MTQRKFSTINAAELAAKEFPEPEWLVSGIIPIGLTVIVAPPKFGKSWLALMVAIMRAIGGKIFGHVETAARPVLYLALEDSQRRLKNRMLTMGLEANENLEFATSLDGTPLVEIMRTWFAQHADQAPLIILDTLGKVMPAMSSTSTQYGHEYKVMSTLKEITDEFVNASLIVIHHTRKAKGDDVFDSVSGTQGIAGAADTIIVLERDRNSDRATMSVTSRDAEEADYSIRFTENCEWVLDGSSIDEAKTAAARAKVTHNLGEYMQRMIELISKHPSGITRAELEKLMPEHVSRIPVYLKRAHDSGRIYRVERGKYALAPLPPVTSDSSVTNPIEKVTPYTEVTPPSEGAATNLVHLPGSKICQIHGTPTLDGLCGRCSVEVAG